MNNYNTLPKVGNLDFEVSKEQNTDSWDEMLECVTGEPVKQTPQEKLDEMNQLIEQRRLELKAENDRRQAAKDAKEQEKQLPPAKRERVTKASSIPYYVSPTEPNPYDLPEIDPFQLRIADIFHDIVNPKKPIYTYYPIPSKPTFYREVPKEALEYIRKRESDVLRESLRVMNTFSKPTCSFEEIRPEIQAAIIGGASLTSNKNPIQWFLHEKGAVIAIPVSDVEAQNIRHFLFTHGKYKEGIPEPPQHLDLNSIRFTVYKELEDKVGVEASLASYLYSTKRGKYKDKIERIITMKSKGLEYREEKSLLPTCRVSGLFRRGTGPKGGVTDADLLKHSGVIVIDFDNLKERTDEVREFLETDKFTLFCHASCSRSGFAVGVLIDPSKHRESFHQLVEYYITNLGVLPDMSCKNESRNRFVSYDPDLFLNENASKFICHSTPMDVIERKIKNYNKTGVYELPQLPQVSEYEYKGTPEEKEVLKECVSRAWNNAKNMIVEAPQGEKHGQFLKAANLIGGFIPNFCPDLTVEQAVERLIEFAHDNTTFTDADVPSATNTLRDGVEYGMGIPFDPSEEIGKYHANKKVVTEVEKQTEGNGYKPFPIKVFPTALQSILIDYEKLGFCADYFGTSMLAVASVAIGNTLEIQPIDSWVLRSNIYAANVGTSSAGKTPPQSKCVKPLETKDSEYYVEAEKQKEIYEKWEAENKRTRGKTDIPEPQKPVYRRLVMKTSTMEALKDALVKNKRGLLSSRTELASMIGDMDKYNSGSSDQAAYIELFDQEGINIALKSSGGVKGDKPFLSILGGIQPSILNRMSKKGYESDGFVFRWVFAYNPSAMVKSFNEQKKANVNGDMSVWNNLINNILRTSLAINDKTGQPVSTKVVYSDEASKIIGQFDDKLHSLIGKARVAKNATLESYLGKMKTYVHKFALILNSLYAHSNIEGRYPIDEVCKEAANGAVELIWYYLNCATQLGIVTALDKASGVVEIREDLKQLYYNLPEVITQKEAYEIGAELKPKAGRRKVDSLLKMGSLFVRDEFKVYHKTDSSNLKIV